MDPSFPPNLLSNKELLTLSFGPHLNQMTIMTSLTYVNKISSALCMVTLDPPGLKIRPADDRKETLRTNEIGVVF